MSKKALVIDDNPVIVRLNESLLAKAGYEVVTAGDGETGLELARSEKPDIIFLDVILPNMHGFMVCKELKKDGRTKHIPVVLMTGTGLEEIARDEADIPADHYLAKPYGLPEMEDAIKKAQENVQKSNQ